MEHMINSDLVKTLRQQRSWTQDQLATVAGMSLRTVQRIEKEGVCSLESRQALAAAFEIDAASLQNDPIAETQEAKNKQRDKHLRRVRLYSFAGNTLGILSAFAGITYSVINGGMTGGEAGIWYGCVGLFGGLGYVGLALLIEYFRKYNIGVW